MSKLPVFLCLQVFLVGAVFATETVTLKYGWKPGIYAQVEGQQSQQKFLGDQAQGGMQIGVSYIMSTKAHEAGLQVDYLDVKASILTEDPSLQGWMKSYLEAVSGAIPSYIINQQGGMSGAVGVPAFREATMSTISPLLKDAPEEQKQQMIAAVGQMLTEDILNQQLATEWNLNVGQWLGAELDNDGTYEVEFETPVAALGNQMVKSVAQIEYSGRVNCGSLDQSQSCVSLLYHSETDNVSVKELLRKMVPPGQPVPDLNVSVVLDLELVTDPETLLPYFTKQTKRSTAPMDTPEGAVTVTQVQESEVRYLYVMGI